MSFQDNRSALDVVREYFEAIERMDARACAAAFKPDGVLHTPCLPPPYPRSVRGREGVEQVFTFLFTQVFKSFAWIDLELYAAESDPGLIFARTRSRTELCDGRPYTNEYACFTNVRNGHILDHTEFFDTVRATEAFQHLT